MGAFHDVRITLDGILPLLAQPKLEHLSLIGISLSTSTESCLVPFPHPPLVEAIIRLDR
jgi:hypothetical protein